MTEKKRLTHFGMIVLAVTVSASIALFEEACNTSQAPSRQVSDSQITAQVKAKLASDVSPSSLTNIDVNTTNGVVTLTGQVENADEKQNAEKVTSTVQRVLRVNNNLQVASAAPVNR
jgi:hyperosmotically inducible periplasmic protein